MNVLSELRTRLKAALHELADGADSLLDMVKPAQDPKFGDYQANFAMPLGKQLDRPPREIAGKIVDKVDLGDLCRSVEIAGPGFINLRLRDDWLANRLAEAVRDERLGVTRVENPWTVVIDYSSPNVAKPMHVGHIRSTVIGDALCRTLRFLGHNVISDNHLGDWGTQFGMIIYGYRHFVDRNAYQETPVDELARLYQLVRRLMDYHQGRAKVPEMEQRIARQQAAMDQARAAPPTGDRKADKTAAKAVRRLQAQLGEWEAELEELKGSLAAVEDDATLSSLAEKHAKIPQAVLEETARLHAGDTENVRLWEEFLPKCRADIQRIYDRLDVTFDVEYGESYYQNRLAHVVGEFQARGLVEESDGALCFFSKQFDTPMIIRKRDGAFLYATTDLATIQYRMETWNPDVILYVVDHRQGEHFGKLFDAAQRWGHCHVRFTHVSFGTVLGDDGRPFRTRSGHTVGLDGLLDEAVRRAYDVVSENDDAKPEGPEFSEDRRRRIAEIVGIGALKYADLSQNRTSDYVFSYDKMLALNGNTATYMQYAYARVRSIFARGRIDVDRLRHSATAISFTHPAERALGLEILRSSEALELAAADFRPNQLTNYLFELAEKYSTFFQNCPVLKADTQSQRDSRLLLCDLTARTLKQGLALLGIDVVEKM